MRAAENGRERRRTAENGGERWGMAENGGERWGMAETGRERQRAAGNGGERRRRHGQDPTTPPGMLSQKTTARSRHRHQLPPDLGCSGPKLFKLFSIFRFSFEKYTKTLEKLSPISRYNLDFAVS